ncbi:hypothetical protein CISG_03287 [Coccidioides immitis RMSCC 3703]|uniref:Uncharacterized protein n=2 Tax=Coccidioides immitis TaxID=5501 RepID=A0A0J8QK99_COCIT|nr:hypothetical protein CIRG_01051 [Coccidioides immitis RMSCC 2394]KMU72854.1 hypothetical protein CISG_03287 [Coccidioides immitis RMSCC 3703]
MTCKKINGCRESGVGGAPLRLRVDWGSGSGLSPLVRRRLRDIFSIRWRLAACWMIVIGTGNDCQSYDEGLIHWKKKAPSRQTPDRHPGGRPKSPLTVTKLNTKIDSKIFH